MSDIVKKAVTLLNEKIPAGTFSGTAKFDIIDEGVVLLDENGAREGGEDVTPDVTLRADADTFQSILEGDMNPTNAFMSGKLEVDNPGMAMQLATALA